MAVKCVRKYESGDGKLFDTQAEALGHDMQFKRMTKLRTALNDPRMSKSVDLIALDLSNDPKLAVQVRDALNGVLEYHRIYGKLKKPELAKA